MAASSTVGAFVSALRAQLAARFAAHGTLNTIRVDLVRTGDTSADDSVVLVTGKIAGGQDYQATRLQAASRASSGGGAPMGRKVDEYGLPCAVQTYATDSDSDVAFQAALDRCALILEEVVLEVRDNRPQVGTGTLNALVTDISYDPFPTEKGGWRCVCRFTVDYQAIV